MAMVGASVAVVIGCGTLVTSGGIVVTCGTLVTSGGFVTASVGFGDGVVVDGGFAEVG